MKQRICKECHKTFYPKNGTQIYCNNPHVAICAVCNKEFVYTVRPSEKPKTCSKECQQQLKISTTMRKYGVKNVSELSWVRKKISERNSSSEVMAKRKATCMKRWGVDNPAKNPEIAAKMVSTMSSTAYLDARAKTCIEKYGVPSPMMNSEIKQKQKATKSEHYGKDGYHPPKEFYRKRMIDPSKVDEYLAFKSNPKVYLQQHYDFLPTVKQLSIDLGVESTGIYNLIISANCTDLVSYNNISSMESDVYEFLCTQIDSSEIIRHDRTMIKPQELDFYLPNYRIGIECNPSSTHNSSINIYDTSPLHYKYHWNKSQKSNDANIFLFHLFGYEWYSQQDIMKSMLCNLLHKNRFHFGGRDTYVTTLEASECNQFLMQNHRQGGLVSSIRLGLRLKTTNELVSVMTFGKLRPTMGVNGKPTDNIWELSRFCNKCYTTVSGSASKLFQYFLNNYVDNIQTIISFSDIAHTTGKLYDLLGFYPADVNPPGYVWVDQYDRVWYNRVSCQKSNLRKLLADDSIDIENHTEKEIMIDHGFVQVYDSGKIKWQYDIIENFQ